MDPGLRRGDAVDAGTVEQPGLGEDTIPSAVMAGLKSRHRRFALTAPYQALA